MFGLYDTTDKLWFGNSDGPFKGKRHVMEAICDLIKERLDCSQDRIAVRLFTGADRKRDSVKYVKSLESAFKVTFDRRLSELTGISPDRLGRILAGHLIQNPVENEKMKTALAQIEAEQKALLEEVR